MRDNRWVAHIVNVTIIRALWEGFSTPILPIPPPLPPALAPLAFPTACGDPSLSPCLRGGRGVRGVGGLRGVWEGQPCPDTPAESGNDNIECVSPDYVPLAIYASRTQAPESDPREVNQSADHLEPKITLWQSRLRVRQRRVCPNFWVRQVCPPSSPLHPLIR